jgi:hypothetical protein
MDSNTPQFIWGAKRIARFLNIVDEDGEPDVAEVYYRHSRGQLEGVKSVGRSLVGHTPTMLKSFQENAA